MHTGHQSRVAIIHKSAEVALQKIRLPGADTRWRCIAGLNGCQKRDRVDPCQKKCALKYVNITLHNYVQYCPANIGSAGLPRAAMTDYSNA